METNNQHEKSINKSFRLYDDSVWLLAFAVIYFTYNTIDPSKTFEQRIFTFPALLFVWVIILFKIHKIHVLNSETIIFRGIFRKTIIRPRDINAVHDWLRGVRVVFSGGSLILWPFIEKQAEFKALVKQLNPDVDFKDMSSEATQKPYRVVLILLGLFLYFGWLIWSGFHDPTRFLR